MKILFPFRPGGKEKAPAIAPVQCVSVYVCLPLCGSNNCCRKYIIGSFEVPFSLLFLRYDHHSGLSWDVLFPNCFAVSALNGETHLFVLSVL